MEPEKLIPDQIIGVDSKGNLIYQSGWDGSYYIQNPENKSIFANNLGGEWLETINNSSMTRVVEHVPELERLLEYLGLDHTERAFIKSAAQQPSDKSILMAFADYIEEKRNKYTEAARLRAVK